MQKKRDRRSPKDRSGNRMRHANAMTALRSFRVIYGTVRQHFREVEKKCGVSGSQLWILREVGIEPGIGVSALAVKLAIHQSTCSQLVEKLVRAGQLAKTRLAEDQRRVGLALTRKGQRTIACAPGPAEGMLPEALHELSSSSLRALNRSLQELIRRLNLQAEGAAEEPLADL